MKNILVLHAYSADNIGDGLLVYETLELLKKKYPQGKITVLSSYPDSFEKMDNVSYICSKPSIFGYNLQYLKCLFGMGKFDLILGVGGGYLRSGGFKESIGTLLTHFPQLFFASFHGKKAIYLPQSIGPLGGFFKHLYRILLLNLKIIYLRDDRSVQELNLKNAQRVPDMAILKIANSHHNDTYNSSTELSHPYPVFSVRKVKGNIPKLFFDLVDRFDTYDSYIQSTVGGNNDLAVSALLKPQKCLSREELLGNNHIRVIVAVRLHAALMALEKGHFVIHLSYERKGFSAFKDLGLENYVFNVNDFNVDLVEQRTRELLVNEDARRAYKQSIVSNLPVLRAYKDKIVSSITEI